MSASHRLRNIENCQGSHLITEQYNPDVGLSKQRILLCKKNKNGQLESVLTSCLSLCFFCLCPTLLPLPSLSFCDFLSLLFPGGGENYRQSPVESNQSTEGELVFYSQLVTLMSWLRCSCLFHQSFLGSCHIVSLLFELRMCCFL